MELRVVKMPEGNFVPEYKDENGKFGPKWNECRLSNDLVIRNYWSLDDAKAVCEKFEKKYKEENGEVVWTKKTI